MADVADKQRTEQLPAPHTLAYSKQDVLSNLSFFFGNPIVPERLRDYSEHHAMTFHFPDAYIGSNTKLRETLNNLILKAPQEWHTQVALPFVKIVGTTVEWDEIRFDVRLLQRVPYEGISRMSTSLRRRHRDRVVRRGVGLMIESDFYATEAGRAHYADQLTSIRYCVQETCNFDTIYAYLTCGNYDFRYDIQKGLRPRRSVRTAMASEINMYGIVQKEQLGLDKAVEDCKFRMSRYSVTPNMLIVPPQLGLYMSLAPEQKLMYPLGGPAAQAAFESGVQGFEARSFRELGVFVSTPYEVSDDQDSVQMLQRSSQVGEFYRMSPPMVFQSVQQSPNPAEITKGGDPEAKEKARVAQLNSDLAKKNLPTSYMDIMVYDEESDRHVHISFIQALHATCYGHVEGPEGDLFGLATLSDTYDTSCIYNGGITAAQWRILGANTKGGANGATFVEIPAEARAILPVAGITANTPANKLQAIKYLVSFILKCVSDNKWVPVEIVICRPFIEHLMLSGIITVAGRDTGATLFGPADMQLSANTSVKTIEGHYTCHTKSVITKPQNVYVMRDIMCSGYVAGANTRFFGAPSSGFSGPQDPSKITEKMDERLSFANDASGEYDSMLAFCAPVGDGAKRDQVISITPRLLPWEVNNNGNSKTYFPGGENGNFEAYKEKFGLDSVHFGEDVRAAENMEFISQGSTNNGLCFIGPHRKFNPFSNMMHELVPGQGHFGPDAIPGDARWRRGEAVSLKAARDSMVSLELAAQSQMHMSKGI